MKWLGFEFSVFSNGLFAIGLLIWSIEIEKEHNNHPSTFLSFNIRNAQCTDQPKARDSSQGVCTLSVELGPLKYKKKISRCIQTWFTENLSSVINKIKSKLQSRDYINISPGNLKTATFFLFVCFFVVSQYCFKNVGSVLLGLVHCFGQVVTEVNKNKINHFFLSVMVCNTVLLIGDIINRETNVINRTENLFKIPTGWRLTS